LKSDGSFKSASIWGTNKNVRLRPSLDMKKPSSKMTLSRGAATHSARPNDVIRMCDGHAEIGPIHLVLQHLKDMSQAETCPRPTIEANQRRDS
jgi:hypothetical protein